MTIIFQHFHTCDVCGCELADKDECICDVCKEKNRLGKMNSDKELLLKVKAAILALLASVGQSTAKAIEKEALTQVPGLTPFNFEIIIKRALKSLIGDGMIERATEWRVKTYELTDLYYDSEHNSNNYEYKEPVEDLYREVEK